MSITTKKVILISSSVGLLLGMLISYFLFTRIITKDNLIEPEKIFVDTVFVEKDKIVVREVKKTVIINDTVRIEMLYDSLENDSQRLSAIDSSVVYSVEGDSLLDTVATEVLNDSAIVVVKDSALDSAFDDYHVGEELIQVSKNELLHVEQIKPEGNYLKFYCRKSKELDSLLMDNYSPDNGQHDRIRVEFWASPLNSVGYLLNKNRLVLFGFYQYKSLKLKYLENGSLQMNYINNEYVLKCADSFQALVIKQE